MKEAFKSTCCYCGVGCGIVVRKDRVGRLTVEGDPDHPVNRGMLCSKGTNLHYTVMDQEDRLLYPEMRWSKAHPLQRVTWNQALDRAAAVFSSLIEKYGPDSVAFYVSGQCLTEEYYVANKLMKGFIGSNNIDTNSRLCMSSAVVGYKLSLGEDSVPGNYEDLELADCFLVAGANPAWCHPILWRRVEAHKAAHPDIRIIVADPRRTQTCALADLHLALLPGTDVALFHGLARALLDQGFADRDFLDAHTEGFEAFREEVTKKTVEQYAEICGLDPADLQIAARWIGESQGFVTLWAMGLNQSAIGVDKNLALINLNLVTGKIGKPGNGPFSLTGQPNAMGGREVGGLANLLPAHRDLANPAHREEVRKFWKSGPISPKPGLTALEIIDALEQGKLKALWIICTNPIVSFPDARRAEKALEKAPFVVVQDISRRSDTLKFADLVLPAAAWAEKEGTMTNSERRISYLNRVVAPPGEALPDVEILCRFARKMGYPGFDFPDNAAIFREHAELTRGTRIDISGLSYEILRARVTVQWPFPAGAKEGQARLYLDQVFATPNGRARIYYSVGANTSERTSPVLPLILTTGRIRDQWHTMTKTGKVNKLNQHLPQAFLEIHPRDAESRGLGEGDLAEVMNPRGAVRVRVKVTDDIRPGVVFLPMHWGRVAGRDLSRANNLTNPLLDPRSKEPDLKFAAVEVKKFRKPAQRVLVVGAGAGAFAFVKAHAALYPEDEITVFSQERHPFYNRVMLPDYISGVQTWDQLQKWTEADGKKGRVQLLTDLAVSRVDPQGHTVTDAQGQSHSYDLLVLATGSRSHRPKGLPENLDGLFTMRTREDADRMKTYLGEGASVLVVGGGLLGIEMAGALGEMGHRVTLLQRSSKLMDRQLDALGSSLLYEELMDRNIDVFFNDEVQAFLGQGRVEAVRLKSGRKIECHAVLFAIGTTPNIELAKAAGLDCNRGVLVNEFLQTSDQRIFAIGEIAEFQRQLYGITAAAEQQAEALVKYLSGDFSQPYQGSLSMNILKVQHLEICSLGLSETPADSDYEEVVFIDKASRYYKKCIIHRNRLVGAVLIGDKAEFLEFKDLIQNRIELSDKRLGLLRSGKKPEPVLGRLICSCNSVGSGNLEKKIAEGCRNFQELCNATGAGLGCGSCRPEVAKILEEAEEPVT